jgi:hypothetical protein
MKGHVETDKAPVAAESRVTHHAVKLAGIGSCRVQAEDGRAVAGFLAIDLPDPAA